MKIDHQFIGIAAGGCLVAAVLSSTSAGPVIAQENGAMKLNCDSQPCDGIARGRAAFNDRNLNQLGGNGRACADCHVPSESFQLSPSVARARFEALLAKLAQDKNADDPLFRPVDADDFRVNGGNASDFSNLVENGLVRVTMPLPANVVLIDPATGQPSAETSADVWRAVIPVFNVAITGPDGALPIWPPGVPRVPIMGQDPNGPNRQGGYQHDARFGTLQEQARGALFAHAQVTVEPSAQVLDDLAAFQQTLFSSPGVERLANAILSGSTFPDPDPELNELEQQGKEVFTRACGTCHGGTAHPSTSTPERGIVRPIGIRYHNILTACPRPEIDGFSPCPQRLGRNARTYRITLADGTVPNGHDVRSRPIGSHGPTGGPRRDGRHTTPQHQQDRSVLPQQLCSHTRRSPRPIRRFLQARRSAESPSQFAADPVVEWPRHRSRIRDGGRAAGVTGVPFESNRWHRRSGARQVRSMRWRRPLLVVFTTQNGSRSAACSEGTIDAYTRHPS